LEKNGAGEYIIKEKTSISSNIWIGKNLVPRLICYSLFFLEIIIIETVIISIQFFSIGQVPNIALFFLIATNGIAFVLFLRECLLLRKKGRPEKNVN